MTIMCHNAYNSTSISSMYIRYSGSPRSASADVPQGLQAALWFPAPHNDGGFGG